jgi:hypothetical protein
MDFIRFKSALFTALETALTAIGLALAILVSVSVTACKSIEPGLIGIVPAGGLTARAFAFFTTAADLTAVGSAGFMPGFMCTVSFKIVHVIGHYA